MKDFKDHLQEKGITLNYLIQKRDTIPLAIANIAVIPEDKTMWTQSKDEIIKDLYELHGTLSELVTISLPNQQIPLD